MALAYPSAEPSLTTHVAKEAFITALHDSKLQLEVTKREPQNVEEALNHAIKLEAYEQLLLLQSNPEEFDDSRPRRRPRNVCTVADPPDAGSSAALRKQVEELQAALAQATRGMAAMAAGQAGQLALAGDVGSAGHVCVAGRLGTTGSVTFAGDDVPAGHVGTAGRYATVGDRVSAGPWGIRAVPSTAAPYDDSAPDVVMNPPMPAVDQATLNRTSGRGNGGRGRRARRR